MRRIPVALVDAEMGDKGMVVLSDGTDHIVVPGDARVWFRSRVGGGTVALPASLLPGAAEPRGDAQENRVCWQGRERLTAMVLAGPVGIANARRRATQLGGSFDIAFEETGTVSRLVLPI